METSSRAGDGAGGRDDRKGEAMKSVVDDALPKKVERVQQRAWARAIFAAAEKAYGEAARAKRAGELQRAPRYKEQLVFLTEQISSMALPGAQLQKWRELAKAVSMIHCIFLHAHHRLREFDALTRTFAHGGFSPFDATAPVENDDARRMRPPSHEPGAKTGDTKYTTDEEVSEVKIVLRRYSDDRRDCASNGELSATDEVPQSSHAELPSASQASAADRNEPHRSDAMLELQAETARLVAEFDASARADKCSGGSDAVARRSAEDGGSSCSLGSVDAVEELQGAYDDEYAEEHEDERMQHTLLPHEEVVVDTLLAAGVIDALVFVQRSAMRLLEDKARQRVGVNPAATSTAGASDADHKAAFEVQNNSVDLQETELAHMCAADVLRRCLHTLLILSLRREIRDALALAGSIEAVLDGMGSMFERADVQFLSVRFLHRMALHSEPRALKIVHRGGYSSALRCLDFHFESELLVAITMRLLLVLNIGQGMQLSCSASTLDAILARTVSALYEYEHVTELRLVGLRLLANFCGSVESAGKEPASLSEQVVANVERLTSEDALEIVLRIMREDLAKAPVMEAVLTVLKVAARTSLEAASVIGDNGGMQLLLRALGVYLPRTNLAAPGERAYQGSYLRERQSSRLAFDPEPFEQQGERLTGSASDEDLQASAAANDARLSGVVVERVLRVLQYTSMVYENRDRLKAAGVFATLANCMESFADTLVALNRQLKSGREASDSDAVLSRWSWSAELISFCAVVANNLCYRSDAVTLAAQRVELVARVAAIIDTVSSCAEKRDAVASPEESTGTGSTANARHTVSGFDKKCKSVMTFKLSETAAFLARLMGQIAVLDAFLAPATHVDGAHTFSDCLRESGSNAQLGADVLREAAALMDGVTARSVVGKLLRAARIFRSDLRVQQHVVSVLNRMAFSQNPLTPRGTKVRPLNIADSIGTTNSGGSFGHAADTRETVWRAALGGLSDEALVVSNDAIALARSMLAACDLGDSMNSAGKEERDMSRLRAEKLENNAMLLQHWLARESNAGGNHSNSSDDTFLRLSLSMSHMIRRRSLIVVSPKSGSNSARNSRMSIKLSRKSSAVSLSPELPRERSGPSASNDFTLSVTAAAAAAASSSAASENGFDASQRSRTPGDASRQRTETPPTFPNTTSSSRSGGVPRSRCGSGPESIRRERRTDLRSRMRELSMRPISHLVRQHSSSKASRTAEDAPNKISRSRSSNLQ